MVTASLCYTDLEDCQNADALSLDTHHCLRMCLQLLLCVAEPILVHLACWCDRAHPFPESNHLSALHTRGACLASSVFLNPFAVPLPLLVRYLVLLNETAADCQDEDEGMFSLMGAFPPGRDAAVFGTGRFAARWRECDRD